MLSHIKKLLKDLSPQGVKANALDFNTALAALLVEVMRADGRSSKRELSKVADILVTRCELSSAQADSLISQAELLVEEAIDLFAFVKQINNHTSDVERTEIVELLWHVAFADDELDSHEEHIVRRIAGLLYVSHSDFIATKLTAKK